MPKSMTGYGRAVATDGTRTFRAECRSVNHRFLELSIRMPSAFNACETNIRAKAQEYLARGRVEIRIMEEAGGVLQGRIVIDKNLARSYLDALAELELIAGETAVDRVEWLSRCDGVLYAGQEDDDDEHVAALIIEAVEGALQKLNDAREEEGNFIANDLLDKVAEFREHTALVEERASEMPTIYREKLLARAEELLEEKRPEWYDDQRLFAETALYADRASIDEEVTRLAAHISALKTVSAQRNRSEDGSTFHSGNLERDEYNRIEGGRSRIDADSSRDEDADRKIREQVQNLE